MYLLFNFLLFLSGKFPTKLFIKIINQIHNTDKIHIECTLCGCQRDFNTSYILILLFIRTKSRCFFFVIFTVTYTIKSLLFFLKVLCCGLNSRAAIITKFPKNYVKIHQKRTILAILHRNGASAATIDYIFTIATATI